MRSNNALVGSFLIFREAYLLFMFRSLRSDKNEISPKISSFKINYANKCQTIVSLGVRATMNEIFYTSMSLSTFDQLSIETHPPFSGVKARFILFGMNLRCCPQFGEEISKRK